METENKDWKPEVGKTVWYFCGMTNKRVFCATVLSLDENDQVGKTAIVDGPVDGNRLINVRYLYPSMEAALASIKIYDLEGKEVMIPRARPIFDGEHLHRFLRDEAGYTERLDSEIKWYSAEVPQKDPNEKTWENVVDAYSTFKEARMGHQEFYRYMDSQLDELVRSREYVHTMKMLHEGGGAAIGGKSDQREGGC